MAEDGSQLETKPIPSLSAPMCQCELVATQDGKYSLKPEESPECVMALDELAKSLGPNSKVYLASRIVPGGPLIQEAVKKLKEPSQDSE